MNLATAPPLHNFIALHLTVLFSSFFLLQTEYVLLPMNLHLFSGLVSIRVLSLVGWLAKKFSLGAKIDLEIGNDQALD